jgi:hypothetical protein
MMKRIAMSLAAAALLAAAPALAAENAPKAQPRSMTKGKGTGTPQTHHCYKEGRLYTEKTHKQCTAEGGKWVKDGGGKEEAPAPPRGEPRADPAPAK